MKTQFLEHLVQHTKCSSDHPILLLFDNHEAHISLRALDLAKSKGIVMFTIPPHTSHRLQLLDKSVYGPFKTYYNRALDGWMRSYPGKTSSIYHIPVCELGFHVSNDTTEYLFWIQVHRDFSLNRDILSDAEIEPSTVSDRPNPDVLSTSKEDHPIALTSTSAELPSHACSSTCGANSLLAWLDRQHPKLTEDVFIVLLSKFSLPGDPHK
ncbi:tigger transposable element-derived protein 1-like [Tachysurus ichikawai]